MLDITIYSIEFSFLLIFLTIENALYSICGVLYDTMQQLGEYRQNALMC